MMDRMSWLDPVSKAVSNPLFFVLVINFMLLISVSFDIYHLELSVLWTVDDIGNLFLQPLIHSDNEALMNRLNNYSIDNNSGIPETYATNQAFRCRPTNSIPTWCIVTIGVLAGIIFFLTIIATVGGVIVLFFALLGG